MSDYWDNRAARDMYGFMKDPEKVARELLKVYIAAANDIAQSIDDLFERYKKVTGLSDEEAVDMLERLKTTDINELVAELKKDPKNRDLVNLYESAAYKHRLTVYADALKEIDRVCSVIDAEGNKQIRKMLEELAERAYYHEIFDIQKRAGFYYPFHMVSKEKIESVISRDWSGKSYSKRLWGDTKALAEKVKEVIAKKLLTGGTLHDAANEIQNAFASGGYEARRLARTEANYVTNQLQKEAYIESEIEKYRYLATLDLKTSKICRELDSKVFYVKDAKVGKNYPPMHPFCRSTTVAYIPDEWLKNMTRKALDPKTGKMIKIPADMNYADWYKKYVTDRDSEEGPEEAEENTQPVNRNLTAEQYDRYKERLGSDMPLTYDQFIKMKEDPEEWAKYKKMYRDARKALIDNNV